MGAVLHPLLEALPAQLLEARPVYDGAPRPISPREAASIAAEEYAYRYSGGAWLLLSRGSDGGMHFRDHAATEAAARGWCAGKAHALIRRILSGECSHTVMFDRARDRFYLA